MTTPTARSDTSLVMEDWLTLQQGHATMYARLDKALTTEQGISLAQVHTLICLQAKGPCAQATVASELRRQAQTLTMLLDRLEARKLAKRSQHPKDRRAHLVSITPAGQKALTEALPLMDKILARPFGALGGKKRAALRALMAGLNGGTGS